MYTFNYNANIGSAIGYRLLVASILDIGTCQKLISVHLYRQYCHAKTSFALYLGLKGKRETIVSYLLKSAHNNIQWILHFSDDN